MPIAIMEESTGDQQDVSMEWMSSPPVSPQKNGNVLKRKAEEDLTLEEKTHEGVEMEVAHDQEVVVDAKERPAVNGTPEDGKSARPHHSSLQSRWTRAFNLSSKAVLDLTNLPSSPASPTFPTNLAKRAKAGPSSSSRVTTAKPKKADGEQKEKKTKSKAESTSTATKKTAAKGKSKSDIVKSGSRSQCLNPCSSDQFSCADEIESWLDLDVDGSDSNFGHYSRRVEQEEEAFDTRSERSSGGC
jgi:hypothetical protein